MKINPWDVMAGLLLITEAGGRLTNYHGGMEHVYSGREIVASNGLIHDRMLSIIVLGNAAPRPGQLAHGDVEPIIPDWLDDEEE